MAAANTDKFMKYGLATATTLDAPGYTINDTSITVASTANMPTDTGITFAMDEIDANGEQVAGSYNEYVGTVASGTSITNVDHANGTDRNFTAGTTSRVYMPVSKETQNRMVDGILVHADQDGTLKAGAVDVAAVLANNVVTTNAILDDAVTAPKVVGLDRSNLTTDSNPYKFSAYASGSTTVAASNVFTKVALASETFDTNSNFDSATNYRYVAPVAGFYYFNAAVGVFITNGSYLTPALYKNGSGVKQGATSINATGGNNTMRASVEGFIQLAATDYVEFFIACSQGSSSSGATGSDQTWLEGFLVSRT